MLFGDRNAVELAEINLNKRSRPDCNNDVVTQINIKKLFIEYKILENLRVTRQEQLLQ
jgi:hypothetical protein